MTAGCNIWMICLILIWFFYGLSRMFQLPQFVLALRSSVWDVFINFLLIDATDRSKIGSDQKRFFIALSLYPLSFFANTPFKGTKKLNFHFKRDLGCSFIFLKRDQLRNSNSKKELKGILVSPAPLKYPCFQIGCVFVKYDLFNTANPIQNLTYIRFGIILKQFYINSSRQEHQIELS